MDTPRKRKSSRSPAQSFAPSEVSNLPPPTPTEVESAPKPVKKVSTSSSASTQVPATRKDSTASTVQRPRANLPSDRFSIRSFLGGSTTSVDKSTSGLSERADSSSSAKDTALDEVTNRRKATRRQKAMSLQPFRNSVSSKVPKQAKANLDSQIASSKDSSRNRSSTLTPGSNSMLPPPLPATPTSPAWVNRSGTARSTSGQSKRLSADLEANWSGSQAGATPSGKAKAVMDWFRRRGTKGYERDLAPITTDFDRSPSVSSASRKAEPSTPSVASIKEEEKVVQHSPKPSPSSAEPAPSVVVTTVPQVVESTPSAPSSRSASGAQSDYSVTSASTAATTVSTSAASTIQPKSTVAPVQRMAPVVAPPRVQVQVQGPAFAPTKLRFHQGALDKNAVTYRSPNDVIGELKTALWNMGVDMAMEGDYSEPPSPSSLSLFFCEISPCPRRNPEIKCVRKSRKKALATNSSLRPSLAGGGSTHSTSSSIGPASSSTLDRRTGLPASPSLPQSPSMGFRSLFNRNKYASGSGHSPSMPTSPSFSSPGSPDLNNNNNDPLSSPMTTSVSQFSMLSLSNNPPPSLAAAAVPAQPLPVYGGDKTADAGDEVRFVVELTRVKNLDKMYCVDIKRMKGGPWSYKHVYEQLLTSLELGPVV